MGRNGVVVGLVLWGMGIGTAGGQIRTPRGGSVTMQPGPAPNHATAVATGPSTVTITWDAVAGARSYLVERRRVDNPGCCVSQSGAIALNGWQDVALEPGVEYAYTVSVSYQDGRVGSTEVAAITPMPPIPSAPLSRNARMAANSDIFSMTPCSLKSSGGPAPGPIAPTAQSPAGLIFMWPGAPNTNYMVDRAPAGTNNWVLVGSTCGGPSPLPVAGSPSMSVRDLAGAIQPNGDYIYRITSFGPNGESGWNTIHWRAPDQGSVTLTPSVEGSTVTLTGMYWPAPTSMSSVPSLPPGRFEITSTFGYTGQYGGGKRDFYAKIYGVPVGTHTFSVAGAWNTGGRTRVTSVPVTVAY